MRFTEIIAEGLPKTDVKKQISKFEELALVANRAGDDAKCKQYQQKIQSLKQKLSESDLDRFKKYTRPVVKTTPKIERTTNPAGRSTDHVEWKVTTPTGEIHRHKSKAQAQAQYDSFKNVSEGAELSPEVIEMIKKIAQSSATPEHKKAAIDALIAKQGVVEGSEDDFDQWGAQDPKDEMYGAGDAYKRGILDYNKFKQTKIKPGNPYSYTKQARQADSWEKGFEDGRYKQSVEEGETWAKHNNPRAGGMSKKSVSSYRRSHPGSKIQTAVTTKPSKLKKGSKAASRRKSFCARMKGMKKHRTGAKTAHDPNSNINKSLRRWHCESIEELHELVMIAEQFIRNKKNEL